MRNQIIEDLKAVLDNLPFVFELNSNRYKGLFERSTQVFYDDGISDIVPTMLVLDGLYVRIGDILQMEGTSYQIYKIVNHDNYLKRLFLKEIN